MLPYLMMNDYDKDECERSALFYRFEKGLTNLITGL